MTAKKKIIIIIAAVVLIAAGLGIYYLARGGFTAKQRYQNCAKTCEDLMFNESNIPLCKSECEEITGYSPTAEDNKANVNTAAKNLNTAKVNTNNNPSISTNTTTNTNISISNQNANTAAANQNTNTRLDYEDREYYCNWVWPQEIIDKETKELIYECPASRPWCNYEDYSYEKIGCCTNIEYTDCITLPNLL